MRRRVLATVLAATALAVALLFIPAASAARDRERKAQVAALQRDAVVVASQVPLDSDGTDVSLGNLGGHHYALYGRDGRRVSGEGPDEGDLPVRQALTDRASEATVGDDLVAAVPLFAVDRQPRLVLRAEEPVSRSNARILASIARLGLAALAALAAAAIAAWLLVRRLVRPLEDIAAAAARIGDGDFTIAPPDTGLPELDEVGRALAASSARVGRLVERARSFSADASHQLRTPLAGLRATIETELYAPRPDPGPALRECLAVVDRLESTVTDLLELAADRPADRAAVAVDELLSEAAGRWQAHGARLGRSLSLNERPSGLAVHASKAAVSHILDVLIDNALGHGSGDVSLAASHDHGSITLSVRDEGALSPERAAALFAERPATNTDDGATTSNRIGLRLARTLAEAEGGRLRLLSNAPTTLALTLRVSPAAE